MRAPVSVIIPTLGPSAGLGPCLATLVEGMGNGLIREVILSDGSAGNAGRSLAQDLGAVFVSGPKGRGGQLGRGAAVATGDWLLFLHDDTVLAEGWDRALFAHIAKAPDRAAAFRLRFDAPGLAPRVVAGWANIRSRIFALPYGDQGLLIPAPLYQTVGGFADIALMEDVAMARALKGRIDLLDATATTSAARYLENGWLRQGAENLWRLARYFIGVHPERLLGKGYQTPH